ncbi:hypothetical protein BZA05DRAFT_389101 [Tricharina praecox]|uniref:uncharacterized protein n=1 Tax=Tricharina praecox TaxID=43433 RepID=UPI002220ED14|nr:uncharacterized protein BZA05DRAFT_389101 [Tricharina praecox]KAI5856621.1 hypothetical protein BZA05DRAFT_389101 [Tricharina praecox]
MSLLLLLLFGILTVATAETHSRSSSSSSSPPPSAALEPRTIAGIAVSIVGVIILLAILLFWIVRRRRCRIRVGDPETPYAIQTPLVPITSATAVRDREDGTHSSRSYPTLDPYKQPEYLQQLERAEGGGRAEKWQ